MTEYSFIKDVGYELAQSKNSDSFCNYLQQQLYKLKLSLEPLDIKLIKDELYISGKISDQAALEKIILYLGNIKGIAKVNTEKIILVNNVVATKSTRFYEIKPKDNLWKIAENIYGSTHGDKYKIIFEANKPVLAEPDDLFVGQIIRIPNIDLI